MQMNSVTDRRLPFHALIAVLKHPYLSPAPTYKNLIHSAITFLAGFHGLG